MKTSLSFRSFRAAFGFALATMLACKASATTAPTEEPATEPPPPTAKTQPVDDAHGGRLFDKWYSELDKPFSPGKTGGPNGDGTLNDGRGEPLPDNGHSYRLKNLFGWDLRGSEGIYGPKYQAKDSVVTVNLLTDPRSPEELAQWLAHGDAQVPAFGSVMEPLELEAIAAFIDRVRTGELPGPDKFFELSQTAPKNYVLRPGGDPVRGKELYASHCSNCHGDDARKIVIDGVLSLGAFSRTKAYEGWFKILNGHPGSPMGRELEFSSAADATAQILDVSAALCDRTQYPALEGQPDVEDGDPRCGAYLR